MAEPTPYEVSELAAKWISKKIDTHKESNFPFREAMRDVLKRAESYTTECEGGRGERNVLEQVILSKALAFVLGELVVAENLAPQLVIDQAVNRLNEQFRELMGEYDVDY